MDSQQVRDEAIASLFDGTGKSFSADVLSNRLAARGWTVHPVRFQSRIVSDKIEKDGEIHRSIAPEFRRRWNPRP